MMIGLGGNLVNSQPGDLCLNLDTQQAVPCGGDISNLLCLSDPNGGFWGKCSAVGGTPTPVPILRLGDVLQRCPNWGCQIAAAYVPGAQTQGSGGEGAAGCDNLISAAGYDCHSFPYYAIYTRTNQQPAQTPQQLGLTPQQTSYLIQQGVIQPITNTGQPITPIQYAPIPAVGPGAPQQVLYSYQQAGVPQQAALPMTTNYPVTAAPMPTSSGQEMMGPVGAMLPGGAVAPNTSTGGPSAYLSTGPSTAPAATPSGSFLAGIPNNYLYIGAAVLALLLLKK